jgi:Peptidase family M1 domain
VVDPGVANQYQNATVYTRGGMTLQALRGKIGDDAFFRTLKDYVATFGGGVASTQDFIAIAQRDSGQDLREFFRVWLYTPGKPSESYCYCLTPPATAAPIGGTVPATLALTLGTAPSFGTFTPGVAKENLATTTANVTSTAGDAALSIADPSPADSGHLVNGTFALPSAVQARAGAAATFAAVGSSAAPLALRAWNAPTSNETVPLEFKQAIGAGDALRTGTYAKVFTLTLSTTSP